MNYRPTALGRFFYLRSQIGLHSFTEFSHEDEFFLDCLQDVGVFTKSRVLKDLVLSIRNISNRLTRAQHLLALGDTVLENCEKLGNPYYEMKMGCGFVHRAWSNWKDISAYRGCVPAKYRMLLRMTRRELLAWDRRIGTVLKSPSKTGCRSRRLRSALQDPWSWKRSMQEEVEREEMIKRNG